MNQSEKLPSLLEPDQVTSVFKVLAATCVSWNTWVATNAADSVALTRSELDLRRQGALVKRIGKELWYFTMSDEDKATRALRMASQPLTASANEQHIELADIAFATEIPGAVDCFIALKILKEAVQLQISFRAAQAGFVPLGPCLLAPLPELDADSFDANLCLKPLPNGKRIGPQRQYLMNLNLAVCGDLTLAIDKTDVELIALDMHIDKMPQESSLFLAPSGVKAILVEYSSSPAEDAYRIQLQERIGFNLIDLSRWVKVRLGEEELLWPSALTFMQYVAPSARASPESWFDKKDEWLAKCREEMAKKAQEKADAVQKHASATDQASHDESLPVASTTFAVPAPQTKQTSVKEEAMQIYPTPPEAASAAVPVKKAVHDSDNEDMDVTDADFSFFDQNSPDTIMREIANIQHPPTPMDTETVSVDAPEIVVEPPFCSFADMITPASQMATPGDLKGADVDQIEARIYDEGRRFRQPVPGRFKAVTLPVSANKYGPGGKYYAGSTASSSSDETNQRDEEMANAVYEPDKPKLSKTPAALLSSNDSTAEDEPPPVSIPWHLLTPRNALVPVKATQLKLRAQLDSLALSVDRESELIDLIGSQICGPAVARLRLPSSLRPEVFNDDMFDKDWLSDIELNALSVACHATLNFPPTQLTLAELASLYEDDKPKAPFKPKAVPRKHGPKALPARLSDLKEPKVLLSRAHLDDKTHEETLCDYEMRAQVVKRWYLAQLSPLDGPKDTINYVFYPRGELVQNAVFRYLDDLCTLYYGCKLGAFLYADKLEDAYLPFQHSNYGTSLQHCFQTLQNAWATGTKGERHAQRHNLVVHFVNPFSLHEKQFLIFLDMFNHFKLKAKFLHVSLQVIDIEQICDLAQFKVLEMEESMALCLQIYDRCVLTSKEADSTIYAPAYQLAQSGIETLKGFHNSTEDFPSLLDDCSPFHVAYSCTPGQPWVTVAWSDTQGQVFRARQFRLLSDGGNASVAPEGGYVTIAAVFVEIWRYTMELISMFPITWHLVVTKVGKRISADEINAWRRMGSLERGPNKFRISVICLDADPPLLVQPPLLSYLNSPSNDLQKELEGKTEQEQEAFLADFFKPPPETDDALLAILDQPMVREDDPSQRVLAVKLSKYQAGPTNLADPHPLASAYLVKPCGLNLMQSAAVSLVNIYHLIEGCSVDDLLQELRNLACLADIGGLSSHGGSLPRHIMHAAEMHTALNGYSP